MSNENDHKSTVSPEDIHMPPPSFWPIVLAFGLVCIVGGLAANLAFVVLGVIISLSATIGWVIEPGFSIEEDH